MPLSCLLQHPYHKSRYREEDHFSNSINNGRRSNTWKPSSKPAWTAHECLGWGIDCPGKIYTPENSLDKGEEGLLQINVQPIGRFFSRLPGNIYSWTTMIRHIIAVNIQAVIEKSRWYYGQTMVLSIKGSLYLLNSWYRLLAEHKKLLSHPRPINLPCNNLLMFNFPCRYKKGFHGSSNCTRI